MTRLETPLCSPRPRPPGVARGPETALLPNELQTPPELRRDENAQGLRGPGQFQWQSVRNERWAVAEGRARPTTPPAGARRPAPPRPLVWTNLAEIKA